MVQNDHSFRPIQKLRPFRVGWTVYIHYDQRRLHVHNCSCFAAFQEHIRFIIRIIFKIINNRTHRRRNLINNDMGRFVQRFRCPIHSNGRTKGIHVANLMSHDDNLIFSEDNLFQSMGLHTGFHTGSLFHLLRLTAIVGDFISGFNNRLITAAAKSQINGILRPCIGLSIGNSIHPHTDTQCDRHFITYVNLPNFIQNGKTAGLDG